MDDAIESTTKSPTKEQNHSFFKQFKRKQPTSTDFKGAAPLNKNSRADVNNTHDDAVPSASTTA